jgi:hypothetical protein
MGKSSFKSHQAAFHEGNFEKVSGGVCCANSTPGILINISKDKNK